MKRRIETLDFNSFLKGEIVLKDAKPKLWVTAGFTSYAILVPKAVLAAGADGSFGTILATAIHIADWLCVGIIMFAGTTWMFGNRTKAIELLIGCCSGYLIIRHARDIQQWLGGL